MATPPASGALPPARPRSKKDTRTKSQAESSAARCRVFRSQKLKLSNNEHAATTQSQPEHVPRCNTVSFKYSARTPVSQMSMSATNKSGQLTLTTRVNGRNTAFYLYYLVRTIRILTSTVDTYGRELDKTVGQLSRKIGCRANKLHRLLILMEDKPSKNNDDSKRKLQFFCEKKNSYGEDLNRKIDLLKVKNDSCALDIRRQRVKLMSKLTPFARDLDVQMKQLNSKIATYTRAVEEKMKYLSFHYSSWAHAVEKEFGEMYFDIEVWLIGRARPADFISILTEVPAYVAFYIPW